MSSPDNATKNHYLASHEVTNVKDIKIFKKDIKKLNYEESMSALEVILKNVQNENISLDNIQKNYIKGHLLLKHCEELLRFVEQEINEINLESLTID